MREKLDPIHKCFNNRLVTCSFFFFLQSWSLQDVERLLTGYPETPDSGFGSSPEMCGMHGPASPTGSLSDCSTASSGSPPPVSPVNNPYNNDYDDLLDLDFILSNTIESLHNQMMYPEDGVVKPIQIKQEVVSPSVCGTTTHHNLCAPQQIQSHLQILNGTLPNFNSAFIEIPDIKLEDGSASPNTNSHSDNAKPEFTPQSNALDLSQFNGQTTCMPQRLPPPPPAHTQQQQQPQQHPSHMPFNLPANTLSPRASPEGMSPIQDQHNRVMHHGLAATIRQPRSYPRTSYDASNGAPGPSANDDTPFLSTDRGSTSLPAPRCSHRRSAAKETGTTIMGPKATDKPQLYVHRLYQNIHEKFASKGTSSHAHW